MEYRVVRYQIYTNGSLSSNDCAGRIGHLWGVVAEFSRLPAGARRVDYATGGSTFGRFRGHLSLEDTSGIVKEELGRWVRGTAGLAGILLQPQVRSSTTYRFAFHDRLKINDSLNYKARESEYGRS